jgi:translocation and assembly module TamA
MFSLTAKAESAWQVEAIELSKMPDELSKNIQGTLKPLLNQPYSSSLESKLQTQTKRALQALGYYQTSITLARLEQTNTLKIDVAIGEPIRWKSIHIEIKGEANKDSFLQKVLSGIPIQADGIVNHDNYEQTKSVLESSLIAKGYFDFKWLNHRLEIHKERNYAVAKLKLDSGNRYRFGKVEVSKQSLARKYIKSLAPFDENTLYDEKLLSEYNLALNKTPYFSAIKVYPQLQNRKDNLVPIRIEVVDKPANTFEVGGGFSTEIGAKARFKWSKPWITEDGHFF